jgi:hypothetical protein
VHLGRAAQDQEAAGNKLKAQEAIGSHMLELAVAAALYTMHLSLLCERRSELFRDPAVFAAALNDVLVRVFE